MGPMRVSVENGREVRGSGVETQRAQIVQKIQVMIFEQEHVGLWQPAAAAVAVDIAADGVDRSHRSQVFENGVFADVAKVQDLVDSGEGRNHLGAEKAVGVTHNAELHSPEPKNEYHFFARGF